MKKTHVLFAIFSLIGVGYSPETIAEPGFPGLLPIPASACATCHPGGLSVNRNAMAADTVAAGLPPDWTVLCSRDADEDGFTNGEELGDPDCAWEPDDGDLERVSDPADPNDVPPEPEPDDQQPDDQQPDDQQPDDQQPDDQQPDDQQPDPGAPADGDIPGDGGEISGEEIGGGCSTTGTNQSALLLMLLTALGLGWRLTRQRN